MDEDDKIRRNMVIFSSGILASAILELPFSSLVQVVLSATYKGPDNWKVWGLGLVILAYMALRYRFSSEGERYISEYEKDMASLRWKYLNELVQAQATYFTKTGREPKVFKGGLSDYVRGHETTVMRNNRNLTSIPRPILKTNLLEHMGGNWAYRVGVALAWQTIEHSSSSTGGIIDMLVEGREKLIVQVRTWLHCTFYSRASIVYLTPIILGLLAALLLCWRLLQIYLSF